MLQSWTFMALAALASLAGEDFVPIAKESLSLAWKLVTGEVDPDQGSKGLRIRGAALQLSSAVVSISNCPSEMLADVPRLLECFMEIFKV